jgi:hypothetical protein
MNANPSDVMELHRATAKALAHTVDECGNDKSRIK